MRLDRLGRRIFWAGLLGLPVMAVGVLVISQSSLAEPRRVPRIVQTSEGQRAVVYEEVDVEDFSSPESLLAGETPDAAEAEKTAQLREKLRAVIDEKASLLNSAALEAEIATHQRQIAELKALKELQRLEQGLKELSDKYPDSLSARRARDVLELLTQRRLVPKPDDGFGGPTPTFTPNIPYEPSPPSVPHLTPYDFADPDRIRRKPKKSAEFDRGSQKPMPLEDVEKPFGDGNNSP